MAEGKSHLVVAIGCTGGRHRSVVIAEDLAAHFRADGSYFVEVQHRDVDAGAGAGLGTCPKRSGLSGAPESCGTLGAWRWVR